MFILVVSLTYEILGRPNAIRPITGETVVFTCDVEGTALTWRSPIIDAEQRDILLRSSTIGEPNSDSTSGGEFTVVSANDGHLVSTYTFPNLDPNLVNNTVIDCQDGNNGNNSDVFYMAGESGS